MNVNISQPPATLNKVTDLTVKAVKGISRKARPAKIPQLAKIEYALLSPHDLQPHGTG